MVDMCGVHFTLLQPRNLIAMVPVYIKLVATSTSITIMQSGNFDACLFCPICSQYKPLASNRLNSNRLTSNRLSAIDEAFDLSI